MTVLAIIGLVSGAVVLTMPRSTPAIEIFTKQLVRETNVMAQSSLLSGVPTALGLSQDQYAMLRYEDGAWVTQRSGDIPEQLGITLEKEGTLVKLSEDIVPLAVFDPTGQATLFTLRLTDYERTFVLESQGDGRITVERGL